MPALTLPADAPTFPAMTGLVKTLSPQDTVPVFQRQHVPVSGAPNRSCRFWRAPARAPERDCLRHRQRARPRGDGRHRRGALPQRVVRAGGPGRCAASSRVCSTMAASRCASMAATATYSHSRKASRRANDPAGHVASRPAASARCLGRPYRDMRDTGPSSRSSRSVRRWPALAACCSSLASSP